jgi:iron(III) transport system permease protein
MKRAVVLASVVVLALISLLPMSRTLAESFLDRSGGETHVTLRWYDEAFVSGPPRPAADEATTQETPATRPVAARWRLLGNSVAISAIAVVVALFLGVPYAIVLARTDAPWRGLLGALYVAPLVLPPLLVAFAWTFLPGFQPPPQLTAAQPSAWGAAAAALRAGFLLGLCHFPIVVLFARRALARVPASLEEAARLAGGPWRALRRVTLPLASPGILVGSLFVFLFAMNDFSLVDYLNFVRPTSDRISVYPFEAFTAWSKSQGESVATALGAPLAILGVALLFLIGRLVGREPRATVTGEHRDPTPWRLGRWRWPAAAGAVALVALAAGLPVAGLLAKATEVPQTIGGAEPVRTWADTFRDVWQFRVGPGTASNEMAWTLWFALGAAVLAVPIAFVLGHHAARTGKLRWMALSILPLAVPPIFLGAGYLRLLNTDALTFGGRNPFLDLDGPRLGSMLLILAKYVPFAIAAAWAAFLEIDPRLEEAAATAGVRPLDRALKILVPLARPALVLGFLLVFVLALREIDTIVLVSSDTVMRRIYTMVHYQRDAEVAALCIMLVALELIPFALFALLVPRRERARA